LSVAFSFAVTLLFSAGYVGCSYYLRHRTMGTPLLQTLFRPRRNWPGYVLRSAYVIPPSVPPPGVANDLRVFMFYELLRVNAYGAIASAVLTVIAMFVRALR
jgi:hypothetical protein